MKIQGDKWRLGIEKDSIDNDENWESSDTPSNPGSLNANDAIEETPCNWVNWFLSPRKLKQNLIYLHEISTHTCVDHKCRP